MNDKIEIIVHCTEKGIENFEIPEGFIITSTDIKKAVEYYKENNIKSDTVFTMLVDSIPKYVAPTKQFKKIPPLKKKRRRNAIKDDYEY